jgi:hypothetical protein
MADTISSIRESMVRAEDIPSWVPLSVKSMASQVGGPGGGIRQRLLTDPRMKKVWQVLQSRGVGKSWLDSVKNLGTWYIPENGLTLQDIACAAFFFYATVELGDPRFAYTRAKMEVSAKHCLDAAKLCRSAALYHGLVPLTSKLAEALPIVGKHFQDQARMKAQRASPYIIERSSGTRGNDEIRVRVRALAIETHRLFGSFLYGTIATVVTVGLKIKPAISAKSVQNWCSGLLSQ